MSSTTMCGFVIAVSRSRGLTATRLSGHPKAGAHGGGFGTGAFFLLEAMD
jgi:hypothetical protein